MTAPVADTTASTLADLLRDCFERALGRPVCLRGGALVELLASTTRDECCEGAAWVRVVTQYPGFPTQDETPQGCWPAAWSLVLEMGASRCAPTPAAEDIPTCDQHTALATDLLDDAAAMLCAAWCFASVDDHMSRMLIGAWEQAPVEGACAASRMSVTISFEPCLSCPEPE